MKKHEWLENLIYAARQDLADHDPLAADQKLNTIQELVKELIPALARVRQEVEKLYRRLSSSPSTRNNIEARGLFDALAIIDKELEGKNE
jgi:DNA repair ATPase RecN